MEQTSGAGIAEALVADVKSKCPSLGEEWGGREGENSEHGDKLVLMATCSGKILIALARSEHEATRWGETVSKVVEGVAKYQENKCETKDPLPYSEAMSLMLEAFDRAECASTAEKDVQLFVRERLADLHSILDSIDVWVRKNETRSKDLEERRLRSVVFHGDIFHKSTPQYS